MPGLTPRRAVRLQSTPDRRRATRHRRDRGAAAVWVALLMIPMLVVAALGIDVGAMHADRQRLQTGADAAALAVAQTCAIATTPCTTTSAAPTAQQLASANAPMADAATARITALSAGYVEVQTTSDREHWFAPVLGIDETGLGAESAARWGYPTGGPSVMPFALSWCEVQVQAGLPPIRDAQNRIVGIQVPAAGTPTHTIFATKTSPGRDDRACTGPSGNIVPGGFGWLEPTQGCGSTVTDIDDWAESDPGSSPPNGCSPSDFRRWIGQTVFIPVFDVFRGSGNNAEYGIFGYVAFHMENYYFAGQFNTDGTRPCGGNERCITGRFLRFADLDTDFDFSATGPQMGASIVQLTLPRDGTP